MKSASTTDMNHNGIDTTRLPGSTSEQYRRKASGMVIASGPCTKKQRFAASGVRYEWDTIRAKSLAATMCNGWGWLPKTMANLPWRCLGSVSMK